MLIRILAALGVGIWCFFVLFASTGLIIDRGLTDSPLTWIGVLGTGLVAPAVLLTLVNRAITNYEDRKTSLPKASEQESELLKVLEERGEVTPVLAAMHTSLTIEESARMLEDLSRKGHLRVIGGSGTLAYGLMETGEIPDPEPADSPPLQRAVAEPTEPLSEREIEVLRLISSGRTNQEIAGDLFVALGTVKAHTNNIYRKLGAKNRAEAISNARELGLF